MGTSGHEQSYEGLEVYTLLMALTTVLHEKRLRDSVEQDKLGDCTNDENLFGE